MFGAHFTDVPWYENYDLDSIFTPVDAFKLDAMLKEANYETSKCEYLVKGFSEGFSLNFQGKADVQ